MTFRENLLKKIEIEKLFARVAKSFASAGNGQKIDRDAMMRLLQIAGYRHRRERDLDLYLASETVESNGTAENILVLDNELPWYRSTVEDVVLRRSPEIREMVSIRNIIKILNDKDILVARKEASADRVREDCIKQLDMRFEKTDLEDIKFDGQASLESDYPEGVAENLMLFAEVLGWKPPPGPFRVDHCVVYGKVDRDGKGNTVFGPLVVYQRIHHILNYVENRFDASQREDVEKYKRVIGKNAVPLMTGKDVFQKLLNLALETA